MIALLLASAVSFSLFAPTYTTKHPLRSSPIEDDISYDDFDSPPAVKFLPTTYSIPKPPRGAPTPPRSTPPSASSNANILPCFPLGATVYPPLQPQILNIFEPRYRKMYNDILLSGSRRFVTTLSVPEMRNGKQIGSNFAEVGSVWYLEELKEVSEMTQDRVKFVCRHFVESRVRIKRVVNPGDWVQSLSGASSSDYLKVEVDYLEDDDVGEGELPTTYEADTAATIESCRAEFKRLVDLQHDLAEDVRFTPSLVESMDLSPSPLREEVIAVRARTSAARAASAEEKDEDVGAGFMGDMEDVGELEAELTTVWNMVELWQSYINQRLVARQRELQQEFQNKLVKYLMSGEGQENAKKDVKPMPGQQPQISYSDLPQDMKDEINSLKSRITAEVEPLVMENNLGVQRLLAAKTHEKRVKLLGKEFSNERKRLEARESLKKMLSS